MLTAATAIHLNKILQEAVQNIIKHANATQLNYTINSYEKIKITIADNGKGFDQKTVKKGNGLENMQWRAKEIGIAVNVESAIDEGTTITINTL
jgi:signal transduction histidine kinase